MAAYAALVSLKQMIDGVKDNPHLPISIDDEQFESLTEIISSLKDFLDGHEAHDDPLERRIADAAHAAEDLVRSQSVAQIRRRSSMRWVMTLCAVYLFPHLAKCLLIEDIDFNDDLQQVIEEMDLIKKEAMEITAAQPQNDHHE